MRRTLVALSFVVLAVPALARDRLASMEPFGLMHVAPTALPAAPSTTDVERRADRSRLRTDAFDRRIQRASELATRTVCDACLAGSAPRARTTEAVADRGERPDPDLLAAMAYRTRADGP